LTRDQTPDEDLNFPANETEKVFANSLPKKEVLASKVAAPEEAPLCNQH